MIFAKRWATGTQALVIDVQRWIKLLQRLPKILCRSPQTPYRCALTHNDSKVEMASSTHGSARSNSVVHASRENWAASAK